jgi:hypothetical protein
MTTYRGSVSDAAGTQATPAFSATQQGKRTVWDKIKLNYARNLKLIALFSDGEIGENGLSKKAGMISKWQVESARYESFNYNPPEITLTTAAAGGGGTALVVADTTNVKAYDTLYNTANKTSCRIDSVTNATTLVITSVGTTAFSAVEGDVILITATAYPEASSNPTIFSKDMDNVYNTLQIVREPVAISNSMMKSAFYATGDYFKLLKDVNLINMMAKVERSWLFGDRASGTGNTTAGGSTLTSAFRTTRGAVSFAANSFDMKGSTTMYKLRTEIPKLLTTVTESQKVVMLCGYDVQGRINEMMNAQAMYTVPGEKSTLREFGVMTDILRTTNMPIEIVRHQAFDKGENAKRAFIFVPENNVFAHLKDRDIRPVLGIQGNDLDGVIDSVESEFGCGTIDGGMSSVLVENCY